MPQDSRKRREAPPREKPRRARLRWQYLILAILLGLFAWKFLQRMQEVKTLQQQASALQAQNNATAQENARLQRAIRYYRTPQYVEQEARAVLGYTMPGNVSILTRPVIARTGPVVRAAPRQLVPPLPVWKQWWRAFFG
jgi:cell division protein FtsB